jgi:hypothetical protein
MRVMVCDPNDHGLEYFSKVLKMGKETAYQAPPFLNF